MITREYELVYKLRLAGDLAGVQKLFAASNDSAKLNVLTALFSHPGPNPAMGPGIVQLALAAAECSNPALRYCACQVIQNQNAWRVDVSPAIETLLILLDDSDDGVRMMASYATGNVNKRKWDMTPHFAALRKLLRDKSLYIPEAAAWALTKFSRAKFDIAPALKDLARLLAKKTAYAGSREKAASALLNHAKKSATCRDDVRKAVAMVNLDRSQKEVGKFIERLAAL